jgi:hypothetical protein
VNAQQSLLEERGSAFTLRSMLQNKNSLTLEMPRTSAFLALKSARAALKACASAHAHVRQGVSVVRPEPPAPMLLRSTIG